MTSRDDEPRGAGPPKDPASGATGEATGEASGPSTDAPAPDGVDGYTITHRGGTRVEVGRSLFLPTAREPDHPWLCTVKLLGPLGPGEDSEATQTILLRSARGRSADEAQKVALLRLSLVYGTPSDPPPQVVIRKLSSSPPPASAASPVVQSLRTFWKKLGQLFGMS